MNPLTCLCTIASVIIIGVSLECCVDRCERGATERLKMQIDEEVRMEAVKKMQPTLQFSLPIPDLKKEVAPIKPSDRDV